MTMRSAAALVLLLPLVARAQGAAPDPFEITQRVASAGAPQVALMRIDQLQPAAPSAPRWGDWEQLRCALMHELKRHQDLIQRVAALPTDVSDPVLRACLMQGARAAIAIARGGAARDFLACLIWRQELPGDEMRLARLLVIESYLVERKSQNAYMLMLRYDQDYKPIDRDTAARFADALLALGREKEAVNWSDFAARRLASSPPTARAFFAALALQSNLRSTREGAQLQLVHALQASGLALAALRLYGDTARFPVGDLDPQAGELYRALIPLAAPAERREILFSLGRIAESLNDYQRAADYFLEAALLFDARTPDAFAVNARLQAAASLRRAGLKDDARNQLDWLQKNIRDAEKLEIVRREMQKL